MVGGRYRLVERIGSGGSGTVWWAHDELVRREVAVRQPRLPGDPEDDSHRRAAHRLYREARAAARVDHPAAVTVHDVVVEPVQQGERLGLQGPDELDATEMLDGLPWIVMELVRGESLHERLRRGPVDPREAARIGLAVLGALHAAHSVGIVHRDLKPANVLLGPDERVVVTDFGIAQVRGEAPTADGAFGGSPEFVAPERMSGRIAGPASDLWSLGVLLYAAIEGETPFRRTAPRSTPAAASPAAESPQPRQAGPLGPLIARLLTPDPERRPDAEEVMRELEAVAGPLPLAPAEEISTGGQEAEEAGKPAEESGSGPGPGPGTHADVADGPPEPPKRHSLLHPAPLALLSALLAGGVGAATHLDGTGSAESAEQAAGATDTWIPHPEPDMAAVLHLPRHYRPLDRSGSATDQPRTALYGDERGGTVQVRLLVWDKAPGSPMDQAGKAHPRPTRTTVQGHEAALADTVHQRDGAPRRVMRAVIRTDDERMYELRVDMPKGTPEEREGTSVFRGARDRLGMVKGRITPTGHRTTP